MAPFMLRIYGVKPLKTALLVFAVCAAGYLIWRGLPDAVPGHLVMPGTQPLAHQELLAAPADSGMEPSKADSAPAKSKCCGCGRAHSGSACTIHDGDSTLLLTDIPPGELRTAIEKLPEDQRKQTLLKLSQLEFKPGDEVSLRADGDGALYFVCTFTDPEPAPAENIPVDMETQTAAADGLDLSSDPQAIIMPMSISNPPVFHSRPGVTNILFLDFNGHDISGTAWNKSKAVSVWHCTAFDVDGDAGTFNEEEQRYIREVWERVSEDYAVFNVDVTTEQPLVWTRNTAHALITPTTDADGVACPHDGFGGIAYVGVFGTNQYSYNEANCYSPAWVRPMAGSSYASTAEASSHELGHNMGLSHDGTSLVTYYAGHTNAGISWAPIMGTAYTKSISQWCKGEYYDANRTQDDLAIISARLTYRPDDHSNTLALASSVATPGGVFAVTGLVERTGDSDCFSITCGGGDIVLTGATYRCTEGTWGGNGDLILYLYDAGGTLLASNNPALETKAVITQTVAAGTYYIKISPAGVGSPLSNPPSGYTVYGSIGPYSISGIAPEAGSNLLLRTPNGGEILSWRSPVEIKWSFGLTNHMALELYSDGQFDSIITADTLNDGTYLWTIPTNQTVSTLYSIKIRSVDNTNLCDWSDNNFSIGTSVLFENFDSSGSTPAGWSQQIVTGTNLWKFKTGGLVSGYLPETAFSGSNNACLYDETSGDGKTMLITPALDFETFRSGQLTFRLHMAAWGDDQDQLTVFYRTNALAGWIQAARYTNAINVWTLQSIDLTNVSHTFQIGFEGNAKHGYGVCLDDVQVVRNISTPLPGPNNDSDADSDGLPDSWELEYFGGATNASPDALAANGLNTVLEAYIAGLDPTHPEDFFHIADFRMQDSVRVIEWTAISGRVYSVSWTSNLLNGFSLQTNIAWPQASYTGQMDQASGFYRLDVQLP